MVVDLILGKKKLIIKNKNMPYRQSPNKMKKSPMEAGCGSPAKAKSPYMMYGKDSGAMMSESPLAKYGCSKKYAKSPSKMEGDDKKIQGRKVDVKRFDSGMTGYNQKRYVNPGGEVIMKFDPKESTKGGTSQYFIQRQGGEASTEKITRDQFRDKLSKGSAKGKFKPFTEKTVGTGGADFKSLELS